jgi:MOSC domain-containing protein YiiM
MNRPMRLLSLQVGQPREVVDDYGRTVLTGIFKEPVAGHRMLRRHNVVGDAQADLTVHGGPDKAVYAYSADHYPGWRQELGRDLAFGTFGENLTIEGVDERAIAVGDVFAVGDALVEVSQPRAPCSKLALRMGSLTFPKRFLASGRTGFYLRVLAEGEIGAGDPVERRSADPRRLTIHRLCRLRYFGPEVLTADDRAAYADAAAHPALAAGWRQWFADRLAAVGGT